MVAIETKYIGPSNHRPSRIAATTSNGQRVVISFGRAETMALDAGLTDSAENAHRVVAQALADKMQWRGALVCGSTKAGYVFVFCPAVDALRDCLPDLQHYAATHRPGPDRRLATAQQALQ